MKLIKNYVFFANIFFVFTFSSISAAEPIQIDFVKDRGFPKSEADKKRKSEFAESMVFNKSDVVVQVSAENEFGGMVEIARRGPGGLGVKGNGDRNAAGEGITSGNRINNGEDLILSFTNNKSEPQPLIVKSITFDRIVQDIENFPDANVSRYQLKADGKLINSGDLPIKAGTSKGGSITIIVNAEEAVTELRITNGTPFHPIANRFRVAGITVLPIQ